MKKVITIVMSILLILVLLATIDIVCISKFDKGPFFAIKTKEYDDGQTKEYYGLGYKVIRYNQNEGKIKTEIGLWNLQYSNEAIEVKVLDLAIDYVNDYNNALKNYYNQYIYVTGTVSKVDNDNKEIVLTYIDPDGKYTLDLKAKIYNKDSDLSSYSIGNNISMVGIVGNYHPKEEDSIRFIELKNSSVKQDWT